jgi:hypothetical protein
LKHPLARWFRSDADREWAAATLQVLSARYRDTRTKLMLGPPMEARAVAGNAGSLVVAEMNRLLPRVRR